MTEPYTLRNLLKAIFYKYPKINERKSSGGMNKDVLYKDSFSTYINYIKNNKYKTLLLSYGHYNSSNDTKRNSKNYLRRKSLLTHFSYLKYNNLDIHWSHGMRQYWAVVPWLTIYNPVQYSKKFISRCGVYLTYLLSEDGNKLYLSLNRGTNKNTLMKDISKVAEICRDHVTNLLQNLYSDKFIHKTFSELNGLISNDIKNNEGYITINNQTYHEDITRARDYKVSNILAIPYDVNKIFDGSIKESTLEDDLKYMINLYKILLPSLVNIIYNNFDSYGKSKYISNSYRKHCYDMCHK